MRRVVTRVIILVALLVLGLLGGIAASSYDFSAAEKGVLAALLVGTAAAGLVLQINARRRAG